MVGPYRTKPSNLLKVVYPSLLLLSNSIRGPASESMPTPNPIKQILADVGRAICLELVRLLTERGRPLRRNSPLIKQLLSSEAVQVTQSRDSGGRFAGYSASSSLSIVALDYLQWLDTGRAPGGKKIPISALIQYIKSRNIGQLRAKSGRYSGRTISVNALAWAIQGAVFRSGLAGRHILNPAWATGELLLDEALNTQALDSLAYDLEQQFTYLATS